MAEGEKKEIRLSGKVANELGVGMPAIIEFLTKIGLKKPRVNATKISEEIYQKLLKEFQSDKTVKEKAQSSGTEKIEKETITLKETKRSRKNVKRDAEQDEIVIKDEQNITAADKHVPGAAGGKEEERASNVPKKDMTIDVKVVGKVDPGTLGRKPEQTSHDKTKKDPRVPGAIQPEEEEIIRAKGKKIEGPKVVDKIKLPEPIASSSDNVTFRKRKRKRIRWEKQAFEKGVHDKKFKDRKGAKKKWAKTEPTEEEIQKQIKETLARLSDTSKSKAAKYRKLKRDAATEAKDKELEEKEVEKKTIKVTEFVSANQLAKMIDVPVNEIISSCMALGMFVSINQRLDAETLTVVAEELGYKVEFVSAEVQEAIAETEDKQEDLKERPPIVTVMGHVDHGKTSLLDNIRNTNVIAGEEGGITQHIGAYEVTLDNGKQISFIDTPGHEAFTAMRARGAQTTDVAIIVIAADDNVMPQTVEAINHAQAAGVPIIFAINKIDKPGSNPDKIKEELSKMNILVEEWGGKYQSQEISAKKGTNIDKLLEKVLLEAELLELKANPNKKARGTVIESSLDKGKGYLATVLVANGTLKIGDIVVAGCYSGKVKALFNEREMRIEKGGPSTPALLLGLNGAPQAGDKFNVMDDEHEAKEIAAKRMRLQREQGVRTQKHITLDEIGRRIAIGDFKELNVIIKGDVDGSIEALTDSLLKLSTGQIQINIIHKSVGQIIESDVLLASASNAIIIGFQVRPSMGARKLAEQEQIDIRLYSVIYNAIDEIKDAMEGMLSPGIEEKIVCNVEIRELFKITKVGTVAGCMVLNGKITRHTKVRVIRDGIVVYSGELGSLKRFKDDVKDVSAGYECGLNILNFNDIKIKDVIEGYEEIKVKKKLLTT